MPPVVDVYVWVDQPTPDVIARFIAGYVDGDESHGDRPRLEALRRVLVERAPAEDDLELLEAASGTSAGAIDGTFTLYLASSSYYRAMITSTSDGSVVLGVSIDDPAGSRETLDEASAVMQRLRAEFGASAGIAGVELPPPSSRSTWVDAWGVQRRSGVLDQHRRPM